MEQEENVDKLMPQFYHQVKLFKHMSRATMGYIKSVKVMRQTLNTFNDTLLMLCDKNWSRYEMFRNILTDSENLYSLLEDDIAKLGNSFQHFADRFNLVMESRQLLKEVRKGLRQVREQVDSVNKSNRAPAVEREQARAMLKEKEEECSKVSDMIIERIKILQQNQKDFLRENYGNFIAAHTDFCKDCLLIQNLINECLEEITI